MLTGCQHRCRWGMQSDDHYLGGCRRGERDGVMQSGRVHNGVLHLLCRKLSQYSNIRYRLSKLKAFDARAADVLLTNHNVFHSRSRSPW